VTRAPLTTNTVSPPLDGTDTYGAACSRFDFDRTDLSSLLLSSDDAATQYKEFIFGKRRTVAADTAVDSLFIQVFKKCLVMGMSKPAGYRRMRAVDSGNRAKSTSLPFRFQTCRRVGWRLIERQLWKLRNLKKGWDGADAPAPNELAFDAAQWAIAYCEEQRIPITSIVPSIEGGIGITFRSGNLRASIELSNEGSLVALTHDGVDRPLVWEDTFSRGLARTLRRVRAFLDP
jgi:hypothetical protein